MKEQIKKFREYLNYVERHYDNVQVAWYLIKIKCSDLDFVKDDKIRKQIEDNVKNHDLSKLSKEEFTDYRRYFYPCQNENKGSIDDAWQHHLDQNQHHWQTWTTENPNRENGLIFLVENIADWMAMGFEFGDTAQEYYESNKHKIKLPKWAEQEMYKIFERVY